MNCGNCKHGRVVNGDLTKRVCRGAPPQPVLMPAGMGKVQIQFHWPLVDATDEGCGLYKSKVVLDTPEGNA